MDAVWGEFIQLDLQTQVTYKIPELKYYTLTYKNYCLIFDDFYCS